MTDGFAGCGVGCNYVWLSLGFNLIIVQNPGGGEHLRVTGSAAESADG